MARDSISLNIHTHKHKNAYSLNKSVSKSLLTTLIVTIQHWARYYFEIQPQGTVRTRRATKAADGNLIQLYIVYRYTILTNNSHKIYARARTQLKFTISSLMRHSIHPLCVLMLKHRQSSFGNICRVLLLNRLSIRFCIETFRMVFATAHFQFANAIQIHIPFLHCSIEELTIFDIYYFTVSCVSDETHCNFTLIHMRWVTMNFDAKWNVIEPLFFTLKQNDA